MGVAVFYNGQYCCPILIGRLPEISREGKIAGQVFFVAVGENILNVNVTLERSNVK